MDTIADNGSSARLVVGSRMTPIHQVDMRLTGMTLEKNGELVNSGTTAEVWGNPAAAVAWLANALSAYDIEFSGRQYCAGRSPDSGAAGKGGRLFYCQLCGLGSVSVRFV